MASANVEIVRRVFAVFERFEGDSRRAILSEGAAEVFDPDVALARIGDEFGDLAGEWRGLAEARAALLEFWDEFEDMRTEAERFIDLGDRVLVLIKQTGRGRRSGVVVEHDAANLVVLRDGKIIRWEGYWDRATGMRAAGLDEDE